MKKQIQIFKPGTHTAMSGATLAFTEADLLATVKAYDPAKFEAPLVVGHPRHDDPAYGWVGKLAFAQGALEASPRQVDPAFAEMVVRGAYKKISASFYAPDAPTNPVPGVYYLRHVGFLGAAAPAVKGLRPVEFSESEQGVVEFSSAWRDTQNAWLWRRLREWMIGDKGLEIADQVIPDYAVASIEDEARKEVEDENNEQNANAAAGISAAFTEGANQVTPEQKAALEAENAALKKQLAESVARDKSARAAALHDNHATFAEKLITDGRLLPAQKPVVVATLDFIAGHSPLVEFGEVDAKKPLADEFKALLAVLPQVVDFTEKAGGNKAGKEVDGDDAVALSAAAVEFQEAEARAGRTVSIAQAVQHISNQSK